MTPSAPSARVATIFPLHCFCICLVLEAPGASRRVPDYGATSRQAVINPSGSVDGFGPSSGATRGSCAPLKPSARRLLGLIYKYIYPAPVNVLQLSKFYAPSHVCC